MTAMTVDRAPATRPALLGRAAQLRLRGQTGAIEAQVVWPAPADRRPALLVFFPDPERDAEPLCHALCRLAGVVVLSAAPRSLPADLATTAFEDAAAVLGWAADHAAELDADPERLFVGGERAGAALAAAVTLHARDQWWPAIARQLLVHPDLDAWRASVPYASSLRTATVTGAAPATVVSRPGRDDHGRTLAARLREAGVDVEELEQDAVLPAPLARALRAA